MKGNRYCNIILFRLNGGPGMYLKRKVDKILSEWHENPSRKPLIIKGARQVGKTESIMRFAEVCYDNIIYCRILTDVVESNCE